MNQIFIDTLIEKGIAAQGAIQNFLSVEGSISDTTYVPRGVIDQCQLAWNNLEIFLTKLQDEGCEYKSVNYSASNTESKE